MGGSRERGSKCTILVGRCRTSIPLSGLELDQRALRRWHLHDDAVVLAPVSEDAGVPECQGELLARCALVCVKSDGTSDVNENVLPLAECCSTPHRKKVGCYTLVKISKSSKPVMTGYEIS